MAAIWKEAKKSRKRDYDVWIYSDHGQEKSIAYRDSQGYDINTVIDNIAKNCGLEGKCKKHSLHGMQHLRTAMLREKEDTDNKLDEDIPENRSTSRDKKQ